MRGNTYYSAEEVIYASGIEEDDNLFFINQFSVMSRLFSRLPYVETASVQRYLPNRVIIDITESQALAYIEAEGQNWVIDRSCKLLTQGTESDTAQLIRVSGVTPVEPTVGETLSHRQRGRAEEGVPLRDTRPDTAEGIAGQRDAHRHERRGQPQVRLHRALHRGAGAQRGHGISVRETLGVVSQLTENDRGTIDLSLEGARAVFSP